MTSRSVGALLSLTLIAATAATAQPAPSSQPTGRPVLGTKAEVPLDIWQIDLIPTGSGFALTTPVLEGDVYVFRVWPDRDIVRLPKSRVKKMVRRTKDINDEVLWQIDLAPTGKMYSRDEPAMKGGTYVFHSWVEGTLMSVRQADVQKVTRLKGLDAFKVHLGLLGTKEIGNLPMEGGGKTVVLSEAPARPAGAEPPARAEQGNWLYFGVPGVTDAWAPPNAVVAAPGEPPKAAPPH